MFLTYHYKQKMRKCQVCIKTFLCRVSAERIYHGKDKTWFGWLR